MTEEKPTGDSALVSILERIRAARFAAGVACPRCGCARVHRWGSFSGRQRYRCIECRRTFSDLTGTPAAYVKKLHVWEDHAQLLEEGLTLRRVAALLGVSVSTAFDWRHRLLGELAVRDRAVVRGSVQVTDLWFPFSEKGCREPGRWRRGRAVTSRTRFKGPSVLVVVACDENAGAVTALLPDGRVRLRDLFDVLAPRIAAQPVIYATTGPLSPAGGLARALKGTFRWVRGAEKHELLAAACSYAKRLKQWLRRFCGVATYYLPNYLLWHRVQEATSLRTTVLQWPLTAGPISSGALADSARAA